MACDRVASGILFRNNLPRWIGAITCATILFTAGTIVEARTVYTNHNDTFDWNGYCVLNNQWGRQQATNPDWYQWTVLEDDNTVSFEYKWEGSQYSVKGYPVVMVGWHYGTLMGYRTPMGTWNLPSRVADNQSYVVSASLSHTNAGTYPETMNFSWDIWFGASENPGAPSHELMVWPWRVSQIPNGTWQTRISNWGAQWDVYLGTATSGSDSWPVVSYLRTSPTLNAGGNLRDFITDMQSRGWLAADAWVIGIEFGPELMRGEGSFHFNHYSLEVIPTLAISLNNTNVSLSWNTNFTGFTLEGTSGLTGDWTTVPGITGFSATLPVNPGTNQFFRLRK